MQYDFVTSGPMVRSDDPIYYYNDHSNIMCGICGTDFICCRVCLGCGHWCCYDCRLNVTDRKCFYCSGLTAIDLSLAQSEVNNE